MATKAIEPVKTRNGTRYKARVRVTSYGKTLHECCKTFDTYQNAEIWADRVAFQAINKGIKGLQHAKQMKTISIGDVIKMVLSSEPTAAHLSRSKKANLKQLLKFPIAQVPIDALTPYTLFEHCQLRCKSVQPQTVAHDLSNLCTALRDANTFYGITTDCSAFESARSSLQRHGYIARSCERRRRLESDEFERIANSFKADNVDVSKQMPIGDIFEIALELGLRLSEITNLQSKDICQDKRLLTVRNRKHPQKNKRHTDTIHISDKVLKILLRQPKREDDALFPFTTNAIGNKWRKLTRKLEIDDLRFHDLRTEAACRMFEAGLSAVEISKVTGHRDLNVLNNHYLPLCASLSKVA